VYKESSSVSAKVMGGPERTSQRSVSRSRKRPLLKYRPATKKFLRIKSRNLSKLKIFSAVFKYEST